VRDGASYFAPCNAALYGTSHDVLVRGAAEPSCAEAQFIRDRVPKRFRAIRAPILPSSWAVRTATMSCARPSGVT
jgi:hypothetical protein